MSARPLATLRALAEPRTLLLVFGGIGALGLAVILVAAMQPVEKPWERTSAPLLTGEMAAFVPADFARPVPERLVADADGAPAYLPELVSGQVTLVNLWASWCAPCLEELPSLVALSEATGARIVPVAQERRSDAQERALARAGAAGALPIYTDAELGLSRLYGGGDAKLPLTVIYDARGREAGRLLGAADWSSPEAVRLVAAVADGAGP